MNAVTSGPQVDESTVRHEERETILRMLQRQALEWIGKPAKLAVLRTVMLRIANNEHHAEAAERVGRVRTELRELAVREGERTARKVFEGRGNHSEVHLTEVELAGALGVLFELGFELGYCVGAVTGQGSAAVGG